MEATPPAFGDSDLGHVAAIDHEARLKVPVTSKLLRCADELDVTRTGDQFPQALCSGNAFLKLGRAFVLPRPGFRRIEAREAVPPWPTIHRLGIDDCDRPRPHHDGE